MKYVKLGRSGLDVSRLCLGCMSFGVPERGAHPWTLSEEQGRPFIRRALSKPHHLDDAVAALSLKLEPEEMAALEEPYVPHPVVGFQ